TDISNGQVAGVIFFGENISGETQIAGVITQLRQAQAQNPVQVPLLLMTDQEGGLVRRLPGQPVLSEKQIGQPADPVAAPAAVGAGVKLVMVSWATYPALDAKRPAGLSPAVIGQELRGRNAFTGVTITDALEAGALSAFGATGQRAVTAAGAGMDLILCSA